MTDRCILTVLLIHCRACDGPKACVQTFISNESRGVYGAATIFTWPSTSNLFNILKTNTRKKLFPKFQSNQRKESVHDLIFAHVFFISISKYPRKEEILDKTTRGQVSSGGKCTISRVATSTRTSFHYIRVESLCSV